MLDPNCGHAVQCTAGPFGPQALQSIGDTNATDRAVQGDHSGVVPSGREVSRFQREHGAYFCCGEESWRHSYLYTMLLFEKQEGEALEFFSQRDNWSETKKSEILAVHPWLRVCCRKCRYEYENYAFVKRHAKYGEKIEGDVDELLQGESHYHRQRGRSIFRTSFYSGGVFDGLHSRNHPYFFEKALASLDSQLQAEKARHFITNGTYDGYLPRYEFGMGLDNLFERASSRMFPASKRNPVGLNPERFVGKCADCTKWMIGYEFGSKYCELCEDLKPSANA